MAAKSPDYGATLHLLMHWLWTKILLMQNQSNPFPQLIVAW